jgi:hypothetical protein
MTKVINTNRKTSTPKPVDIEEQTDEDLNLHDYKTDL